MFPTRGEALDRTIEFEAALADLYSEALNSWVVQARPLVIPDLTGQVVNGDPALVAASTPPNPSGVDQTAGVWDQLAVALILAGLSTLWSISLVEAMSALGMDLPDIDLPEGRRPEIPRAVRRAITSTSSVAGADLTDAVRRVESHDRLREARDDFVAKARETLPDAPALVRDKVAAAVRDAGPKPGESPG